MFPQLDLDFCLKRQRRLLEVLESAEADRAILTKPEQVYYFTGFRPHHLMAAAVCIDAEDCLLVAPNEEPSRHAASRVVTFEAQRLCTLRQDQQHAAVKTLKDALPNPAARVATDGVSSWEGVDIEPEILQLRRRKDADEVAMIRHAIRGTEAMYARAREIIVPGITELRVFNELQSTAVETIGEMLTGTGNDYQCNAPGGPPRDRAAGDGELYILDLGPAYRGYYADNCRTFAVNGQPTDEQLRAYEAIVSVLDHVAATVKPGVSCAALYAEAKTMLDEYEPDSFSHHLGHGIGLFPHEAPRLNPNWDDTFQEGEVFTAEPGLYTDALRAGIRVEENYLVTANGVEQLTRFPTAL
ncbi:MAG: aminopeptidase P family protein [Verrucomicrobia subdivision 3 bacterium]|nr:aminopeptidase P family protein [Limisphaerales bacterium]